VKVVLHTDGGARGNPGPAGIGVVLADADGQVLDELALGIGRATNNVAEYEALIAGLELALEHGATEVEAYVDSRLVASQVKGEWKIKNDRLRGLAVKARALMGKFERASIDNVPREANAGADRLANQGMDSSALE
jgi:ribonuclease HI